MRRAFLIGILAAALALMAALCGCSAVTNSVPTPTKASVIDAENENGAIFSLTRSQFISNINTSIDLTGYDIAKIDDLQTWDHSSTESDDGKKKGEESETGFTFYTNNLTTDDTLPSFDALVYDGTKKVGQVRIDWTKKKAKEDSETFHQYAIVGIMAATGFNEESAEAFYKSALDNIYVNGSEVSLSYTCYGNIRCYCMVSGDYEIIVIEPYSDAVRKAQEEIGVFAFIDMSDSLGDPYDFSYAQKVEPAKEPEPQPEPEPQVEPEPTPEPEPAPAPEPEAEPESEPTPSPEPEEPSNDRNGVIMQDSDRFKGLL
ncbi:MAG: hypothetical protein K6G78_00605 [bacterium]|nr:hypothetical protein [bacterium]